MKWVVGFEGRFRVEDAVIGGHVVVDLVEGKGREGKGREGKGREGEGVILGQNSVALVDTKSTRNVRGQKAVQKS